MTGMLLVDYAWQHPAPAAVKAAGYGGVIRYLSPDPSKNLSPAERDALHAAGLGILLVWESTANRAGQGQSAGADDAHTAEQQADALGYPTGCPLFYAVDFDTNAGMVAPYFAGAESATTYPVGAYGGLRVIEGLAVPWLWQACAWSGGKVSTQAHLYQRLTATVAHPLAGTDENIMLKPVPLWTGDPVKPAPQPHPSPTPAPTPTGGLKVNTLDLSHADNNHLVRGPGVIPLQRLLQIKADGLGGAGTRGALVDYQRAHTLAPDAVFGVITASAMLAGR